jgi:hypothetical protein
MTVQVFSNPFQFRNQIGKVMMVVVVRLEIQVFWQGAEGRAVLLGVCEKHNDKDIKNVPNQEEDKA